MAHGILNILLGLHHNQEQLLLLAHSVRNPPAINAAQGEGFLGVSLSQSEKLVERNLWQQILFHCSAGKVWEKTVITEDILRLACVS